MAYIEPSIAVITRTKDRPKFLLRALESLSKQTNKNYLHVVVNDGGDQANIDSVLQNFPNQNRIVIHNKHSTGLATALNQGIRAAGDVGLITILDDDDTWHPQRLEATINYMNSHMDVMAIVVRMDIIEEEITSSGDVKEVRQYMHPDSGDGEISLYKQCIRNYISNGIVTYRRSVFNELKGYDENLPTAEDWDFGIRLLTRYDVDFIKTDHALFYYHQRPKDTGTSGNTVFAGARTQEETINKIRNKYLREDIKKGTIGVGYIMNQAVSDIANTVRLEAHVNRAEDALRRHMNEAILELTNSLKDLKRHSYGYRLGVKIKKLYTPKP